MAMLPPDDNEHMGHGDYPFNKDDFKSDVFEDYDQARLCYDTIVDWDRNPDVGFSPEQWYSMITEIDNIQPIKDEDGNIIGYEFDFEWESPDGEYSGHGHAH